MLRKSDDGLNKNRTSINEVARDIYQTILDSQSRTELFNPEEKGFQVKPLPSSKGFDTNQINRLFNDAFIIYSSEKNVNGYEGDFATVHYTPLEPDSIKPKLIPRFTIQRGPKLIELIESRKPIYFQVHYQGKKTSTQPQK